MQQIINLSHCDYSLCLFIAPPAWGKTRLLHQLIDSGQRVIYFSPLRALAAEFTASLGKKGVWIEMRSQMKEKLGQWKKARGKALILTPEILGDNLDTVLAACEDESPLIVLDEVHLFFRWGLSFRPLLWELLLDAFASNCRVWGLTATVDQEMEEELGALLPFIEKQALRIDLGNMRLKYTPAVTRHYPHCRWGKKLFSMIFLREIEKLERKKVPGTVLLFVPYRQQVAQWLQLLQRKGVRALGCVGGEVKQFVQELNLLDPPRVIVATSALSHGVNLPQLHSVFINQKLCDNTFWVQMVGRGGRRGEGFQLHTFDGNQLKLDVRVSSFLSLVKESSLLAIRQLFTL